MSVMETICAAGMRVIALFAGGCILKLALPRGAMKRSAERAVDMALFTGLLNILSEALNG